MGVQAFRRQRVQALTVIFEDEGLCTALKVAAARNGQPAQDIGAQAVREWLEAKEDEELRAELEEARREWEREGGRDASEFLAEIDAGSPE